MKSVYVNLKSKSTRMNSSFTEESEFKCYDAPEGVRVEYVRYSIHDRALIVLTKALEIKDIDDMKNFIRKNLEDLKDRNE